MSNVFVITRYTSLILCEASDATFDFNHIVYGCMFENNSRPVTFKEYDEAKAFALGYCQDADVDPFDLNIVPWCDAMIKSAEQFLEERRRDRNIAKEAKYVPHKADVYTNDGTLYGVTTHLLLDCNRVIGVIVNVGDDMIAYVGQEFNYQFGCDADSDDRFYLVEQDTPFEDFMAELYSREEAARRLRESEEDD